MINYVSRINQLRTSDGSHYEKRGKGEPVCIDDEIPFEIPESWEWVRLEALGILQTGKTPSTSHQDFFGGPVPFITPGDITYEHTLPAVERSLSIIGSKQSRIADSQSILQVCIGGSAGKTCLIADRVAFNQQINAITCYLPDISKYLFLAMCAPLVQNHIEVMKAGTATPIINKSVWAKFLIPLPPIAEQRAIVAQIDRVLPFTTQYGVLEEARERLDAELSDHLRKSVLQLAVQGRLVEQDSSDEPASALLERIRAERAALMKAKMIRAPKGGESIIYRASDGGYYEKRGGGEPQPIEVPFDIPDTWEWARLSSVVSIAGGGTPDKGTPSYWNGGIPWASVKDLKGDTLESTRDSISAEGLASKPSISKCTGGDLIVATRLVPGKSIICSIDCTINQDLKRIRTSLNVEYLHIWFQSKRLAFHRLGQGTTVPGIKLGDLEEALISIPPAAEQQRICLVFNDASRRLTSQ